MSGTKTWNQIRAIKAEHGILTKQQDKANELGRVFAAISSNKNLSIEDNAQKAQYQSELDIILLESSTSSTNINEPFTYAELTKVLKNRRNSSPGIDKICYLMIATCLKNVS